MNEFRPYSKEQQLKGHKRKDKPKPKFVEKRPKKKKNLHLYRGRIVPGRRERTKITELEYSKMIEYYENYCYRCLSYPIQAHHVLHRSQMGCGNWRNLIPLCHECHEFAHKNAQFKQELIDHKTTLFGRHFGDDKYTLFKLGKIHNTTDEAYERFMKGEEENVQET